MWSRICGGLASQIESPPELALLRLERARTIQADNHDQAGRGDLLQNGEHVEHTRRICWILSWSPLVHVCTNAAVTGRMALGLAEAKTNQASEVIGKGHHCKENQNNKTGGPLKVLHFW